MRRGQIVTWGLEGPLLEQLQGFAQERGLWLREVRRRQACLGLLLESGRGVLVIRLGRNLEEELGLLEQASRLFPEQAVIVVGDVEHPALAALAWDLGASCVLFPPQPAGLLAETVAGFL